MTTPTDSDTRFSGALTVLDRATHFVERPVRAVGARRSLNPLPHAGTISTFLLIVVVLSGVYITLFFSFGHAASYDSVAAMEDHAIQRVVRAIHRYASALLVLTTIVHGWRIFAAQRFTGRRRRWRWASGAASLTLVWLAGVTGYWLIWDRRAAAINEAFAQLARPIPGLRDVAVDHLLGVSPGSGAGFLFALWLAHLALSAVLGYAVYRHVRRTRLPWLPPTRWMAISGGALVLASLLVPVGMLGPARPDQLVADMPLDPFVLFLLPALLADARWLFVFASIVVLAAVSLLPRLLRRHDPAPIIIDVDACTGCELCVVDCPYDALAMVEGGRRGIAEVDPEACVACGICLGSCAFDAITMPGFEDTAETIEVGGRVVAVVCERQLGLDGSVAEADVTLPVRCTGMFSPMAVSGLRDRGAVEIRLVGCDPSDCRYGVGSSLMAERFGGDRAPHPPRALEHMIRPVEPVHPDELDRNRLVAPVAVVALSVAFIVAATRAPFSTPDDRAGIRVVIDHTPGTEVAETGEIGGLGAVSVSLDGVPLETMAIGGGTEAGDRVVGFADWETSVGRQDIVVESGGLTLFHDSVDFEPRRRLVVTATDVPPAPDAAAGRDVFTSRAAGCDVCHSVQAGRDGVGPTLAGVATLAGSRVEGLDAENYLRQSILLPDQYVVEGWPAGQMLPIYRERLSAEELEALIEYLLSLEAAG